LGNRFSRGASLASLRAARREFLPLLEEFLPLLEKVFRTLALLHPFMF
jgi:hypothetical protein